jgi:hypothetical protein
MEQKEFFSPKLYQYLYCFHRLFDGKRTMRNLIGEMGVPSSTAYENIKLLGAKGYLNKQGSGYVLSRKGLDFVDIDHDTFDHLVFWVLYSFGCAEDEARRIATGFVCRQPITVMRLLAVAAASRTALSCAGGFAKQPLAAFPPGRHDAGFSACGPGGDENGETEHTARRPAVFIVGEEGKCVIELYAPHIRRIAASALPGGHRAIPKRLLYDLGGNGGRAAYESQAQGHVFLPVR